MDTADAVQALVERISTPISARTRSGIVSLLQAGASRYHRSVLSLKLESWMRTPTDSDLAHAIEFGLAPGPESVIELARVVAEDPARLAQIDRLVALEHKRARRHRMHAERERRAFEALKRRVIGGHYARAAHQHVSPVPQGRSRQRAGRVRRARRSAPRASRAGPDGPGDDAGNDGSGSRRPGVLA